MIINNVDVMIYDVIWKKTGVNIAFRNLSYTKNGVKRLQDLNGYFRAGSTCAVVGAPDAGISTFFDVLCGRDQGKNQMNHHHHHHYQLHQ
jgi:ABC-type multidrug transport system ATPase subunit